MALGPLGSGWGRSERSRASPATGVLLPDGRGGRGGPGTPLCAGEKSGGKSGRMRSGVLTRRPGSLPGGLPGVRGATAPGVGARAAATWAAWALRVPSQD